MRRSEIVWLGIVLLFFAIGILAYPQMPERMATHWNAAGEVDGYASRFWGVFLLPLIYTGLVLLFIAIPRIDPLKSNIEQFRRYYDGFVYLFSVFFLSLLLQIVLWSSGLRLSPNILIPVAAGLLFYYIGILCEHARRNWFIGIRTPWTLSSEDVWDSTHRIGARLFKIAGAISVIGAFFGSYAVLFVLVPAVAVSLYTIIYSYLKYQEEAQQRTN